MPVRMAPLIRSRAFGTVSLKDIESARSEASEAADTERSSLDTASIDAAFLDCEIESLQETSTTVSGTIDDLGELEKIVVDHVGASYAPNLGPLRNLLTHADSLLKTKIAERTGNTEPEAGTSVDTDAPTEATSPSGGEPAAPGTKGNPRTIASREDVVRMLDKICDYYARHEPPSPIPLLLRRARRLVAKDFMGIMQDLAPDALTQIEMIRGPEDSEDND